MRIPAVVALIVLLVSLVACATRGSGGDGPLASSLLVETFGDSVRFSLQVTNASQQPVRLTFPTAQLFEFVVEDDGQELWRWSAERMFAQAVHEVTLAAGETRAFDATWQPPAQRRELTVRARLVGQPYRVEQQTRFHLH
jgi:hypothetical protein